MNPPSPICCADYHNEMGECDAPFSEVVGGGVIGGDIASKISETENDHAKRKAAKRYANRIGGENDVLGMFAPSPIKPEELDPHSILLHHIRQHEGGDTKSEMLDQLILEHSHGKVKRRKPKMAVLLFGPFGKSFDPETKVREREREGGVDGCDDFFQ
jgi:hypothetical protein